MRRALQVALVTIAAALSCRDQGPDPLACDRGYGFGYYGCTDVTGVVLNSANQPVASAVVTAGASTDPYEHVQLTADSNGKFAVRLMRRWVQMHPEMDTVSTWFHAATPGPASVSDSVFVQVQFAPVGKRPMTTAVVISVP